MIGRDTTQMVVWIPKEWIEKKRAEAKAKGLIWSNFAREEIVRILMADIKDIGLKKEKKAKK